MNYCPTLSSARPVSFSCLSRHDTRMIKCHRGEKSIHPSDVLLQRERFPSKISCRPTHTNAIRMQIVRHLQGADAIASLIEFYAWRSCERQLTPALTIRSMWVSTRVEISSRRSVEWLSRAHLSNVSSGDKWKANVVIIVSQWWMKHFSELLSAWRSVRDVPIIFWSASLGWARLCSLLKGIR